MEFGFDADQLALRAAARELFEAEASLEVARAGLRDPERWRPVWATLTELGWPGLAVPECFGGSGLGAIEAVALLEQAGRVACLAPLVPTAGMAVGALLAMPSDAAGPALERVARGAAVTTLAATAGCGGIGEVGWDGDRLAGGVDAVPDAGRAELVVLAAVDPAGAGLLAIVETSAPGVRLEDAGGADRNRPLQRLALDGVVPQVVAGADAEAAVGHACVMLAAELLGVAQRALEISVAYATERRQFGSPIGAFQGIKHALADVYVAVERARSLVYHGAMALADEDLPRAARIEAAWLAKAAASDAALCAVKTGVQVHGAIALSFEHDLHILLRRARQGAQLLGDATSHYARVGRAHVAAQRRGQVPVTA